MTVTTLADRLHDRLFAAAPFAATYMGLPGYDADVPDGSAAGDATLRADLDAIRVEAAGLDAAGLSADEQTTLGCVTTIADLTIKEIDAALGDHTVTAMPFAGPPELFAVAARTGLANGDAAADYLTRLNRSGEWIDRLTARLRDGAARGRLPVAALVEQAIAWADATLQPDAPAALLAPAPPAGWDGESQWRDDVLAAARDVVRPALARWRALLADELLPRARSTDQPGLGALPSGDADYRRLIQLHTTLDIDAGSLHQIGVDTIAELEDRALALGAELGLSDLPAIHAAMREAAASTDPHAAMEAARDAVRRAEARAAEVFPEPLPPPCEVAPMPPTVAESGMAPHYTPPRPDGTAAGTYWYNTMLPTAGGGWDLEAVAFHEAVPGHHLQMSRSQLSEGSLPALQRNFPVTAHAEGWGLYAEQLAEEMGLYSDARQLLGGVTASLMRAARLVLDSGLHALGWTRAQAIEYYTAHVPLPREFLANEVDRYITMPGQALAYLTGKREILRLRDEARSTLGSRFDLPGFHAAVLDAGSLPIPVLEQRVRAWTAAPA
ncbi:MAG TPA: DUF885 domain-containing protein [Mycobacteriales bacterium]|nr:DUF885 domain-containing protein [Mycobacteriales bacterium]